MPKVEAPFFCGWASGSIGGVLTCNWKGLNNTFIMQKHKSRSGKRHEIQIENSKIFAERMKAVKRTLEIIR